MMNIDQLEKSKYFMHHKKSSIFFISKIKCVYDKLQDINYHVRTSEKNNHLQLEPLTIYFICVPLMILSFLLKMKRNAGQYICSYEIKNAVRARKIN